MNAVRDSNTSKVHDTLLSLKSSTTGVIPQFWLSQLLFRSIPDYNVGFAKLAADTESNANLNAHADIVGDVIIDALIKIALSNADSTFSGTYTAS